MRRYAQAAILLLGGVTTSAFIPLQVSQSGTKLYDTVLVDERTGKPTGTSFLPEEAIERAKVGNPIEKIKIKKDGTSAWTDIYDYAAKIRAGELDWKDVEKGDMDNVCINVNAC